MPPRNQDLAPSIDAYLQGRGSPMAGQGMAFLRAGRKYGIDPRLLVGIATIESGAGAHQKLAYNPFNWGVHRGQTFSSYEEAIMQVARGLKQGYVSKGLTTPQQIVSKYAPSSDGNDESNWAKVVGQVMGQLGGNVPAGATHTQGQRSAAALSPSPLPPQAPTYQTEFDPALFSRQLRDQFIAGKGRIDLLGLGATRASSYKQVPLPPPVAPAGTPTSPGDPEAVAPQVPKVTGKGLTPPLSFKKTHDTSNLGWPAIDIMAKPGTPVRSPVGGTIEYFHPTGAQGGGSMLLHGDDGHDYWLGHIANGITGPVKAGQQIAVISPDHAAPHLHWARN